MDSSIVSLLQDALGEFSIKNKGNLAFFCPFCKHYKQKLEVHVERGQWNCWVCGSKGKSFYSLFKKLQVSNSLFERLFKINPKYERYQSLHEGLDDQNVQVNLPKEFVPLWVKQPKNFYYNTAINYLKSRGVVFSDIFKYRLGYCEGGQYDGMVIFPNYNKDGKLNYFTNRSFLQSNSVNFINPPINRNVVGFELQLNYDMPLIICESALDAISIKINASPLYGKFLSKILKLTILENEIKDIIICLDPDALRKAYEHAQYFMGFGINVHYVQIPESCDANSLGYEKVWKLILNSKQLNEHNIFKNKVIEKLK